MTDATENGASAQSRTVRDIRGALHGSRLISLPHVIPEVEAMNGFIAGDGPVLVEVGFDHGRRLHSTALLSPSWRVVGLETRRVRVEEANDRAARQGLRNLLAWRMDARTVFAGVFEVASVDVVEVLFPTPWWNPALRAKRLLLEPDFVADVCRALRPGGIVHVATDVPDYAAHIEQVLRSSDCLVDVGTEGLVSRPPCAQLSRREYKCANEGTPVTRFVFRRVTTEAATVRNPPR